MRASLSTFRCVALLGMTLLLALGVAGPASAAEKLIWGPNDLPNGKSAFPTYQALGVDTLQISITGAEIVPTKPRDATDPSDPAYRWPARVDTAIGRARASGIKIALLVKWSPPWANGNRARVQQAPDPKAWASIMTAVAKRYPAVTRWMVWGEPNRSDSFRPNRADSPVGPRAYAKILDATYGALKRVSPRNVVIGGMTWTGGTVKPGDFMRFMRLPNGKPPRLDWFGHNPFPSRFPDLSNSPLPGGFRDISDVDTLGVQLKRTYGTRVRLWLSEFLVQSDRASNVFRLYVSRAQQARWLTAAFQIADRVPQVAGMGWLSLSDQPSAPGSANWGLLTSKITKKPSYAAFRDAPAVRFRPTVRAPSRMSIRDVAAGRLGVRVRVRVRGRLSVRLLRRGRAVAVARRGLASGKSAFLRLRYAGHKGKVVIEVRAQRAETVRRALTIR